MAIVAIPDRQQIRQQIQRLCPEEPALSVGQPSHSEGADSDPPPEVASRFLCVVQSNQQMVAPAAVLALPEARPAWLIDSACAAAVEAVPCMAPDALEDPCCQKGLVEDQCRSKGATPSLYL